MIQKILTRNFLLVCFAQLAFSSVFSILIPTLPIYLSKLGSREGEIGVLIGSFYFSSVVLRPFVGKALSRFQETTFMLTGALLYALTALAFLWVRPFWPFLMVRILQGIGFAFFSTASFTLIANISPENQRGESLSYFYMVFNLAGALGPLLGMFLINHFGFTLLFLVCAGLSLCSLFTVYQLGGRQVTPSQESSVAEGFLLSWKAVPPSLTNFFSLFIWGGIGTFFPLYAIHHGVTNPGLFFTATAIMLILARAFGAKILDLYAKERIILSCLFTYIISVSILAFSKTLPMFILVAMIWGMGYAFLSPSLMAYVLGRGDSSRGPVIGMFLAISDLGMFLGPVIMGIILHTTSYRIMFLCLALTAVINLNYFFFFVRKKGRPL